MELPPPPEGRDLPAFLGPEPLAPVFERYVHDLAAGRAPDVAALCTEVGPRVLAFPLLTPGGAARLLAEIDRRASEREARGDAGGPVNSMHRSGVVLGELGLGELLAALRTDWLAPLARAAFADVGGADLDGEHGFLAEYGPDHDQELGFHVDDSAVTLNLCLGGTFTGSELYFRGLRCDLHREVAPGRHEAFEVTHHPGIALLHAGRHRHGVLPLRSGRRRSLILWLRSRTADAAAARCPVWCGARAFFGGAPGADTAG